MKTKNSNRKIKMPIVLQKIMNQYLKVYEQRYSKDAPFLFGGYTPIHIRNVRKKFVKVTNLAELPKIKLHSLRHSHASLLINRGVVAKAVAERLGNTEAEVLKTYSHLFRATSDACVEVIDEEFLISTFGADKDDRKTSIAILKLLGYNLDDIYQQLSGWNQKNISYMQVVKGITDQLIQN